MASSQQTVTWESVLIGPDLPLEQAIKVLDAAGQRIAIVVDASRRLLGTLTDGDVRRALIRSLPMSAPVAEAMFRTPLSAPVATSKDELLALMESHQVLQIPLVGDDATVLGLETLHGLLRKRHKDNAVFLMAGGFGTRLQPECPKPLLKVGDKPILEVILQNLAKCGIQRFYISTHYKAEMIREHFGNGERWGVHITYVHEEQPLGTGGALGLLPHDEINEALIVMNGDLLTNLDFDNLLKFHREHDPVATMCVREHEHRIPYGVIQGEGHRITSMVEKPAYRYFINAGIYVLSPQLVRAVAPGERVDMPSLLERHMAAGREVNMFPVHEYWLDIGRMEDFHRAQGDVGALFNG